MTEQEYTTTKSIGYALRSLYPGAYASYQGAIFRVTSPDRDVLTGIKEDRKQSRRVNDILSRNPDLLDKAYEKIRKFTVEDSGIKLPARKTTANRPSLIIVVPKVIDLRFDDTLDYVFCQNHQCGMVYKLSWFRSKPKNRLPPCAKCGERLQQAPIFAPQKLIDDNKSLGQVGSSQESGIRVIGDSQVFCHYGRSDGTCSHPDSEDGRCVDEFIGKLGSLIITDPQRPFESIRRANPNCPKGLDVDMIPLRRPFRTRNHYYRIDFPRESLTVPLQISVVNSTKRQDDPEIEMVNAELRKILGQVFDLSVVDLDGTGFSRMQVLEIVHGFKVGNRISGVTHTYLDQDDNEVPGRITNTQGFEITIKPTIYERIESIKSKYRGSSEDILENILHSLKHALLVLAPLHTGFEPDKFHGSYDVLENGRGGKVYVYDTDDGGNGGFSTLIRNNNLFEKMIDEVRERRLLCPVRDCEYACKQCLFIKNCGMVNKKLNRHALTDSGIFLKD